MTVQRWKCTSYCLCGSRKGHFEKSDDEGVWVRYEAAHALEQENERLRALLTQAPIAKVTVRESGAGHYAPDDVSVSLYAPGLPPGEHDLYLMPSVPQSAEHGEHPHK